MEAFADFRFHSKAGSSGGDRLFFALNLPGDTFMVAAQKEEVLWKLHLSKSCVRSIVIGWALSWYVV